MFTIKFDKAVKYKGVRYAAHTAFDVEDGDIAELKQAGAIVLEEKPETPAEGELEEGVEDEEALIVDDANTVSKEELLEYTAPELIKFAKGKGIDLQGKTRKADIYNIIVASLN